MMTKQQATKLSDEELMTLTVANREYFGIIIERYESRLMRYIRRITNGSKEDAEDLLQEVFIKLYKNLYAFDPKLKFSSWAYRITYNHVVSQARKKKTKAATISLDAHEYLKNIITSSDETIKLETKEQEQEVLKSLQSLKEKYRHALYLRFFENLSYNEIADIMKTSPKTVATWISRGKKELEQTIKKSLDQNNE